MQEHVPVSIIAQIGEDLSLKVQNSHRWGMIKGMFKGKTVTLTVEQFIDKRTLSQNALYWVYISLIAAETGDDQDALHAYFRQKFIPTKIVTIRGEEVAVEKSTTKLNKEEFSAYLDKIAALTGIAIPNSEEGKSNP